MELTEGKKQAEQLKDESQIHCTDMIQQNPVIANSWAVRWIVTGMLLSADCSLLSMHKIPLSQTVKVPFSVA